MPSLWKHNSLSSYAALEETDCEHPAAESGQVISLYINWCIAELIAQVLKCFHTCWKIDTAISLGKFSLCHPGSAPGFPEPTPLLYWLARTALTDDHKLAGLSERNLLSHSAGGSIWSLTWRCWQGYAPSKDAQFSSVQFSHSVVSNPLQPHGLQHARPPCPSPTPGVSSNSCPLSQWCHPTISSSVVPFSCLQSFAASGSLPMSQFFSSGGQIIGVSVQGRVYSRPLPQLPGACCPFGVLGL